MNPATQRQAAHERLEADRRARGRASRISMIHDEQQARRWGWVREYYCQK